jgi:hypothetical protein
VRISSIHGTAIANTTTPHAASSGVSSARGHQADHQHHQRAAKKLRHRPLDTGLQQQIVERPQTGNAAQLLFQRRRAAVGAPFEDVDPFDAALAPFGHQPQAFGDAPRAAAVGAGPPQPRALDQQDHGREQQHHEGGEDGVHGGYS